MRYLFILTLLFIPCLSYSGNMILQSSNIFDENIYTQPVAQSSATGGSAVNAGGYRIHTFTLTGSLTVWGNIDTVNILVVGGGGGGGAPWGGGGGGGGGLKYSTNTLTTAVGGQAYQVVIGTGGTGGTNGVACNGVSSSFGTIIISSGGGGGGGLTHYSGHPGASGGGCEDGGRGGVPGTAYPPAGLQGYDGGQGYGDAATYTMGGGGGGAGEVGHASTLNNTKAGDGGEGRHYDISITNTWYSGGGGGGCDGSGQAEGIGGQGGGGDGGKSATGDNGTANTGGGGGGGGANPGGIGGSGIIIVRYPFTVSPSTPIPLAKYGDGSDDKEEFPQVFFTTGCNPHTFAFWFKSAATGADKCIVSFGANQPAQCCRMWIKPSANWIGVGGAVDSTQFAFTNDSLWHHLTCVFPVGGTENNDYIFYLDGVIQTHTVNGGEDINYQQLDSPGDYSRCLFFDLNAAAIYKWNGSIAQYRWYNRALDSEEISSIMGNGIVGAENDMTLAIPFDHADNTTDDDLSGQGNNALRIVGTTSVAGPIP